MNLEFEIERTTNLLSKLKPAKKFFDKLPMMNPKMLLTDTKDVKKLVGDPEVTDVYPRFKQYQQLFLYDDKVTEFNIDRIYQQVLDFQNENRLFFQTKLAELEHTLKELKKRTKVRNKGDKIYSYDLQGVIRRGNVEQRQKTYRAILRTINSINSDMAMEMLEANTPDNPVPAFLLPPREHMTKHFKKNILKRNLTPKPNILPVVFDELFNQGFLQDVIEAIADDEGDEDDDERFGAFFDIFTNKERLNRVKHELERIKNLKKIHDYNVEYEEVHAEPVVVVLEDE